MHSISVLDFQSNFARRPKLKLREATNTSLPLSILARNRPSSNIWSKGMLSCAGGVWSRLPEHIWGIFVEIFMYLFPIFSVSFPYLFRISYVSCPDIFWIGLLINCMYGNRNKYRLYIQRSNRLGPFGISKVFFSNLGIINNTLPVCI